MGAARSTLSRRLSETVGVALFAAALIWLIALASYEPSDPVWFFSTEMGAPANFAGRVGAFLAELSFQLFGYGSYLLPAVLAVSGWHYFWCRAVDAVYTKIVGAVLVLSGASALMSLALGTVETDRGSLRGGGYVGEYLAGVMAEYLSRTGSLIVILGVLFVAVIFATQFSFGRFLRVLFKLAAKMLRSFWYGFQHRFEERRKTQQRL